MKISLNSKILGYAIIQMPELLLHLYEYFESRMFCSKRRSVTNKKLKAISLQQGNEVLCIKDIGKDEGNQTNVSKRLLQMEIQYKCLAEEMQDLKLKMDKQTKVL